jgi:2-methylisocitrate lyase-like PEP mutase family enzyme
MTPARALRTLLVQPGAATVPGAANALTARLVQEAGFPTVLFTGAGFANLEFAIPDLGLTTMTEVVDQVGRMVEAVDIPVIADADTGYGNPLNVQRTVREFEQAGAAAIILEDQVFPKRCGHFDGKDVIPLAEMIAKVHAAVDARRNADTVIIARTDARAVFGIEHAIDRARMFVEAGADGTFVEAPMDVKELALIPQRIGVPQMANMVEGGKTPVLPTAELGRLGFKLVVFANAALRASLKAMQDVLGVLARDGTTDAVLDRMVSWEERQRLVDLRGFSELEARYASTPSRAREDE